MTALAAACLAPYLFAGAEIKLIANPSVGVTSVTADDIKGVFLANKSSFGDGSHVEPVFEKGGPTHESFVKEYLGKFKAFSGGITISTEVRLDADITASNAGAADALSKELSGLVEQAKGFVAAVGAAQPQLEPLIAMLDTVKVSTQENVVSLKGKASSEVIEKAIKR